MQTIQCMSGCHEHTWLYKCMTLYPQDWSRCTHEGSLSHHHFSCIRSPTQSRPWNSGTHRASCGSSVMSVRVGRERRVSLRWPLGWSVPGLLTYWLHVSYVALANRMDDTCACLPRLVVPISVSANRQSRAQKYLPHGSFAHFFPTPIQARTRWAMGLDKLFNSECGGPTVAASYYHSLDSCSLQSFVVNGLH